MVMYATATELAGYLQRDLDTYTATQALTIASDLFRERSRTPFEATSTTYTKPAYGSPELVMPFAPLIAVSAVRINGVTLATTEYKVIEQSVFRRIGFGVPGRFPPDTVEVDYTYGFTTVPDNVKGAVLETAAAIYASPDITVAQEWIDDYRIRSAPNTGGFQLSEAAQSLADWYRGTLVA